MSAVPFVLVNERPLQRIRQAYAYYINLDGNPLWHEGYFVVVPSQHEEVWRHAIEKATNRKIENGALTTWQNRFTCGTLRVCVSHIVLDVNGNFDSHNPVFIEHGSTLILDSQQRNFSRIYSMIQSERKKENIEKERLQQDINEFQRQWARKSLVIESLIPDTNSNTTTIEEKSSTSMEKCKYTQEVRDLVCRFAVLGAKYRKIPAMVREVLAYRFPQQEFRVPSKSSVDRIVQEGGLKSKLQSLKILHEMTSLILGQDLSTSRGRTLLALSALGDDKGVVLSTTEIVNHSAQSQANQIEKIIAS